MEIGELKQRLQDHFTDGLVTIVGSGLSVSEDIPGMVALAGHLLERVPQRLNNNDRASWGKVEADLSAGKDLETALLDNLANAALEAVIVELTASFILETETKIVQQVIAGERVLRFTRLLGHMLKPNTGIPIITTNYDRLIEIAAEAAGLGVDTLFVGQLVGRFNPKQSRYSLCRGIVQRRKTVHRTYADHIVLLKPHGSLDWFFHNEEPIRCPLPLNSQRLIITPGFNKYRSGYERPFDAHRERANHEIDNAARYLIIGYGFNDDHLHTHLESQLRGGKPTLVLTRGLSAKTRQLIKECSGMIAVCADKAREGASVLTNNTEEFFPDANLWDLDVFINEVLEP